MHVLQASIGRFRNLLNQRLDFSSRVTLITGDNGQGKTNVLEAIYLLAHARSFRGAKPLELIPWDFAPRPPSGEPECFVELLTESDDGTKQLRFELVGGRRQVSINGTRITKASDFFGQFRAVVFTPDDVRLVKGAPQFRRQFADRIVSLVDPVFVESSVAYERALRSRNVVLKRSRGAQLSRERQAELESLSTLLISHGRVVAERRRQLIADLQPIFQSYYDALVGNSAPRDREEQVRVTYRSDFLESGVGEQSVLQPDQALKTLYFNQLEDEMRRGLTLRGPHRDELLIDFNFLGSYRRGRASASQGQARSAVLALTLAAVDFVSERTGETPVLLLDDIESELDARRRQALFELIHRAKAQAIVTLTEVRPEFEETCQEAAIYRVVSGHISRVK
ncbi:MAG: DNA replication/repair protein RecF [Bdellovibrionales bacterium]|nr:DNA replication/repair protein RecF [Bdellovibrionales bacterium]